MEDSNSTMMSHSSSRKRKALSSGHALEEGEGGDHDDSQHHEDGDTMTDHFTTTTTTTTASDMIILENSTSMEYLLSVPLDFIFRQIPPTDNTNGKPLLTRAEARCLLRIASLSKEWDILIKTYTDQLERRAWTGRFAPKILNSSSSTPLAGTVGQNSNKSHPMLRPLLPILSVHGEILATQALTLLDDEMHNVVEELQQCRLSLRQFAENNWSTAESLLDTLPDDFDLSQHSNNGDDNDNNLPKGAVMAREKRRLSDLEEEICQRIESLMVSQGITEDGAASDEEEGEEDGTDEQEKDGRKGAKGIESYDTSIATVCLQLWKLQPTSTINNHTDATDNATTDERDSQWQQPQSGLFNYPEPMQGDEKETQGQTQHYSTQITMAALDDPSVLHNTSKGQVQQSSADMDDDDDDETIMNEDDNDNDAQGDRLERNQKEDSTPSQQSHHSIVSNHSEQDDMMEEMAQQPSQHNRRHAMPTESQVQNAGEALVMFACQQSS